MREFYISTVIINVEWKYVVLMIGIGSRSYYELSDRKYFIL